MTWQKKARLGIAVFVAVFVVVVALAMRQRRPAAPGPDLPRRTDPESIAETREGGHHEHTTPDGKLVAAIDFKSQVVYPNGRAVLRDATLTLPDRGGHTITVSANELENVAKENQSIGIVHLTGNVHLKSDDGLELTSAQADYDESAGIVTVPGAVQFRKGRMTGSGVNATYDQNRQVIWLNEQARIDVAPGADGSGAMTATAGAIGVARADHYVRLTRDSHITADGRQIDADDITIALTADDERVQRLELRGNSRITGGPSGPSQSMSARDIDLAYSEDGRTLQSAKLVDNAVLQLPGQGSAQGNRISGRTIDLGMAADGSTVSSLNASENVQVDIPAAGDEPAKRIRSASLVAGGGEQGLQTATFAGSVDYRETRAARPGRPAASRVARSNRLVVDTKPGLGALQRSAFSGNVRIEEGTGTRAEAPHVVYQVDRDQMTLSPGDGKEPGPAPHLSDGRVNVDARTIVFTPGTRKLTADTRVRSSMLPESTRTGDGGRVPSMLNQDQPVNVTSNRLEYDGAAGHAVYTGNARLWQTDTSVTGATIVVDDKSGNLEARGGIRTTMLIEEADSKAGTVTRTPTVGTSDTFLYDDAKRVATYTTNAHIVGSERDVTGDRIVLFLDPKKNELQRAEAYGTVQVKESGRVATGSRLTYTAASEEYFMTGTPVVVVQKDPNDCKQTTASSVKFRKAIETIDAGGVGPLPLRTTKCTPGTF